MVAAAAREGIHGLFDGLAPDEVIEAYERLHNADGDQYRPVR